jgi:hypothetical protein
MMAALINKSDFIDKLHERQSELLTEYLKYPENQAPSSLLVAIMSVQDNLMSFVGDFKLKGIKKMKITITDYLNDPKNIRHAGCHKYYKITCADGFTISVQASEFAYCEPRDNFGPWSKVECGYPSATPEFILEFAENSEDPCDTVYPYTPVELVDKLLEAHGGIANG